ncbi:MAG: hypothetical protein GWN30_09355, partial [Gammaproteobacteria bacterium]|nr:hypothetical protein [Gammaproteobacteria bacterium]
SDEVRSTLVEGAGYLTPKVLYLLDTFSDLTDIIPGIQTPTLLIWGDQDRTLYPELYPHLA